MAEETITPEIKNEIATTEVAKVVKRKKAKRTVASGQVRVLATFNNTIVSFTDHVMTDRD